MVRLHCCPSLLLAHVNWDKLPFSLCIDQTIHWAFARLGPVLAAGAAWPLGPEESDFLRLAILLLVSTRINHIPLKLPTTFDSYSDVNKASNADANINSHDPVVLH